jgi:hypothetical protein
MQQCIYAFTAMNMNSTATWDKTAPFYIQDTYLKMEAGYVSETLVSDYVVSHSVRHYSSCLAAAPVARCKMVHLQGFWHLMI